jgi:hypothetical protein
MDNAYPPDSALILVGVMTHPRDLEIARLLGWYRIPLRFAPRVIAVDYVAFYQNTSFGPEHGGKIEFTAALRGHELTTRAELLHNEQQHPRANEEYYKLALAPLQALPRPIPHGKWRRITFLYTLGNLLHQARTLDDLIVPAEERAGLWHSLRERALSEGSYTAQELPEDDFALDPALLAMLGGLTFGKKP